MQVEHYCRKKESWFRKELQLKLENGIPSHDTFERVFSLIDPCELEKSFRQWVGHATCMVGETISIDGKTLCGSGDLSNSAIHMVSAWSNMQKLVLGQLKTHEKSKEITAVPELLEMLDIADCVITADAMSCQKGIARKITDKRADYVLGLKGNQGSLFEDVKLYFTELDVEQFAKLTRAHWGIENSLHWVLDVGFNEDKCRTRKDTDVHTMTSSY